MIYRNLFDIVDHKILLKKLCMYGVGLYVWDWFKSYLTHRKQFIEYEKSRGQTECLEVHCGVPQGSILGPLLFIIYVNDLCQASALLEPIMFADDTNLFCSGSDIQSLFRIANRELEKISTWFKANKLSLNESKTKFTFFHKPREKDNLPLKLPTLKINQKEIKRTSSIKFLGIMIDENLSWNDHIQIIENKLSKNVGLLYKAKSFLSEKAITSIYFPFFHSYLTYGNIAWGSTSMSKLKKIASKQRQAVKIIPTTHTNSGENSRQIMVNLGILNIFKINIFQVLKFMFQVKNNTIPDSFQNKFQFIEHQYPTRYSENSFIEPRIYLRFTKYAISSRRPRLWNKIVNERIRNFTFYPLFRNTIKACLLRLENEISYF